MVSAKLERDFNTPDSSKFAYTVNIEASPLLSEDLPSATTLSSLGVLRKFFPAFVDHLRSKWTGSGDFDATPLVWRRHEHQYHVRKIKFNVADKEVKGTLQIAYEFGAREQQLRKIEFSWKLKDYEKNLTPKTQRESVDLHRRMWASAWAAKPAEMPHEEL